MAWQEFRIKGFAPDADQTLDPGICVVTKGFVPTESGVQLGPVFLAETSTSSFTLLGTGTFGSARYRNADGSESYHVGGITAIAQFTPGGGFSNRSGTTYAAGTANPWHFAQFGNVALAASKAHTIQKRTTTGAGNFSDLTGAPKASIIVNVGGPSSPTAMAFDYNDGTDTPDGWYASALANYASWTVGAAATQAVNGQLLEPSGTFTAAIGYRNGVLAFKRNATYLGEYTGETGAPWFWRRISSDVGCIGKYACVHADDMVYFADEYGIWVYDGSYPRPCPGEVHRYWASLVSGISSDLKKHIKAVYDETRHLVYFHLGIAITDDGSQPCVGLAYNTRSQLWTCLNSLYNIQQVDPVYMTAFISEDYALSGRIPYSITYAPSLFSTGGELQFGIVGGVADIYELTGVKMKAGSIYDAAQTTTAVGFTASFLRSDHSEIAPQAPVAAETKTAGAKLPAAADGRIAGRYVWPKITFSVGARSASSAVPEVKGWALNFGKSGER